MNIRLDPKSSEDTTEELDKNSGDACSGAYVATRSAGIDRNQIHVTGLPLANRLRSNAIAPETCFPSNQKWRRFLLVCLPPTGRQRVYLS